MNVQIKDNVFKLDGRRCSIAAFKQILMENEEECHLKLGGPETLLGWVAYSLKTQYEDDADRWVVYINEDGKIRKEHLGRWGEDDANLADHVENNLPQLFIGQ